VRIANDQAAILNHASPASSLADQPEEQAILRAKNQQNCSALRRKSVVSLPDFACFVAGQRRFQRELYVNRQIRSGMAGLWA